MADTDALTDVQVVARTLDGEAGNQSVECQTAVGNVIQNRANLAWQGEKTARGVCLHHLQFDCWLAGSDRDRIMEVDYIAPLQCTIIANQVVERLLVDNTNGATHYFDDSIAPPSWADPSCFTVKFGKLNFYNLSK